MAFNLEEHDEVIATRDLDAPNGILENARGTIVHCYENGDVYEVEFTERQIVLTVYAADLKLA